MSIPASTISVLYVDDEAALLDIGRLFLERDGLFSVATARSAHEALALMETASFDIIVSDYQMPVMDGIAFLQKIRKTSDIPYILFTGKGREEVVIEAINSGVDFYIQKGGDPMPQFTELAHKIRQAVERRRAELALHDSERRLSDLINFLPDATFAIDRDRRVIAWNRAIEEMTGVPADQMLGKGDHEYGIAFYGIRRPILIDLILHPDPETEAKYPLIQREGEKLTSEIFIPGFRGGKGAHLWFTASPLSDAKGTITGAIESIRDITSRKLAEEAVRAAEDKLSTVFRSSPDMIAISELDTGRFLDVNDAAVRIFGFEREEFTGKSAIEMRIWINPDDRSALIDRIRSEGRVARFETRQRRKNGEVFDAAISAGTITLGGTRYLISTIRDISELKRTEQALRESEERYRNVVEGQTEFISRFTPGGIHVFANEAYLQYFGKTRGELIGHRFVPSFPAEDAGHVRRHFASLTPENPSATIEHRIIMPDGSTRWQQWSDTAVFDGEGNVFEYQSVGRDITLRKQAEEHLMESEERYRSLAEASPDLIFVIDGDDRVSYVNTAAARMLGSPPGTIPGLPRDQLFPPDISRHQRGQIDRVFATQKPAHGEGPLSFGGRTYHFDHYLVPIKGADGRTMAVLGISRDISDRRAMERALRESEQKYRGVIENLQDVFYRADAAGTIIMASPSVAEVFGYGSIEEVIGLNLARDIYKDPAKREDLLEALNKTGSVKDFEAVLKKKDGTPVIISTSAHYYCDADGTVLGVEGIAKDITESKQAEKALRESGEKYRALVESSFDGIVIHQSGSVVYANATAARLLGGTSADHVIGHPFLDFVHPEYRAVVAERSAAAAVDVQPVIHEKFLRLDGGIIDVDVAAIPFLWDDNPAVHVVFRDVTDRILAEEALRQSESRLGSIIRVAPIGIGVVSDRIIQTVNDRLCQMSGYAMEELIGKSARVLYPTQEDFEYVGREKYAQIAQAGSGTVETRWQKKDGTLIHILLSSTPIDPEDLSRGVTFTALDISGLRQVSEDLQEKNEAIRAAFEELTASEEALRKSYLELDRHVRETRELTDSLPDIIYRADTSGNVVYMNKKGLELLEVSEKDMINQPFLLNIHPDDLPAGMAVYRRLIETGEMVSNFECRLVARRGKGRVFPVIQNVSAVRNEQGAITGTQGIALDISDKKRAEDALLASEMRLRVIVEQVPGTLWTTDTGLVFTSSHGAALREMGLKPDQMVGMSLAAFYERQPDREQALDAHRRALKGETVTYDARYGDRSFISHVEPLRDHEGSITGTLGIAYDLTGMHRAEEKIRLSEELHRSLVSASPDGICIASREGIIAYASPRTVRLFGGGGSDEATGACIFDWVAAEDRDRAKNDLKKILDGVPAPAAAYKAVRKDGSTFMAEINVAVIQDVSGGISGIVASIRDITDRIGSQDALRLANTKLNLLSSITRHDILNKLMVIEGYLSLLREPADPRQAEAYLEKITAAAGVIRNILAFTRDYQNMGVRAPEWLDAGTVFARQLEEFDLDRIAVKNNLLGIQVYADPLFEKVMYNLIDNAFHHGGPLSQITTTWAEQRDGLVCTFEDNGGGIPASEKERIFERGVGKGTGLGLFLAREILGVTGMTIRETGEPGRGARFEIRVPKGKYRIG